MFSLSTWISFAGSFDNRLGISHFPRLMSNALVKRYRELLDSSGGNFANFLCPLIRCYRYLLSGGT